MASERFRCFEVTQYVESMRQDLWERLADLGIPVAAQLHDRDVYTEAEFEERMNLVATGEKPPPEWRPGDLKKPHWHILFYLPSKRYANGFTLKKFFAEVTEPLGIPAHLVKKKRDKTSALRYLVHLDHPDKAQYDPADMKLLNGFPEPKFNSSRRPDWDETMSYVRELHQMINDSDLTEFSQLVDMVLAEWDADPERGKRLQWTLMRNTQYFGRLLDSRRYERRSSAVDRHVQQQRASRWSDLPEEVTGVSEPVVESESAEEAEAVVDGESEFVVIDADGAADASGVGSFGGDVQPSVAGGEVDKRPPVQRVMDAFQGKLIGEVSYGEPPF